jgi:hypothetical protein
MSAGMKHDRWGRPLSAGSLGAARPLARGGPSRSTTAVVVMPSRTSATADLVSDGATAPGFRHATTAAISPAACKHLLVRIMGNLAGNASVQSSAVWGCRPTLETFIAKPGAPMAVRLGVRGMTLTWMLRAAGIHG